MHVLQQQHRVADTHRRDFTVEDFYNELIKQAVKLTEKHPSNNIYWSYNDHIANLAKGMANDPTLTTAIQNLIDESKAHGVNLVQGIIRSNGDAGHEADFLESIGFPSDISDPDNNFMPPDSNTYPDMAKKIKDRIKLIDTSVNWSKLIKDAIEQKASAILRSYGIKSIADASPQVQAIIARADADVAFEMQNSHSYFDNEFTFKDFSPIRAKLVKKVTDDLATPNAIDLIVNDSVKAFKHILDNSRISALASSRDFELFLRGSSQTWNELTSLFPDLKSEKEAFETMATQLNISDNIVLSQNSETDTQITVTLTSTITVAGEDHNISKTFTLGKYPYATDQFVRAIQNTFSDPDKFIPIVEDSAFSAGLSTVNDLSGLKYYHDIHGYTEFNAKSIIQTYNSIYGASPNFAMKSIEFVQDPTDITKYTLRITVTETGLEPWESLHSERVVEIPVVTINPMNALALDIKHKLENSPEPDKIIYMSEIPSLSVGNPQLQYTRLQESFSALQSINPPAGGSVTIKLDHMSTIDNSYWWMHAKVVVSDGTSTSREIGIRFKISKHDTAAELMKSILEHTKYEDVDMTITGHTTTIDNIVPIPNTDGSTTMTETMFARYFMSTWFGMDDQATRYGVTMTFGSKATYNASTKTFSTVVTLTDADGNVEHANVKFLRYLSTTESLSLQDEINNSIERYIEVINKYAAGQTVAIQQIANLKALQAQFDNDIRSKFSNGDKIPSHYSIVIKGILHGMFQDKFLAFLIDASHRPILDKLALIYGGADRIPQSILDNVKKLGADLLNDLQGLTPEQLVNFLSSDQLDGKMIDIIKHLSKFLKLNKVLSHSFKVGLTASAAALGLTSLAAWVTAGRISNTNRKAKKENRQTKIRSSKALFFTSSIVGLTSALGSVGMMLYVFIAQGGI